MNASVANPKPPKPCTPTSQADFLNLMPSEYCNTDKWQRQRTIKGAGMTSLGAQLEQVSEFHSTKAHYKSEVKAWLQTAWVPLGEHREELALRLHPSSSGSTADMVHGFQEEQQLWEVLPKPRPVRALGSTGNPQRKKPAASEKVLRKNSACLGLAWRTRPQAATLPHEGSFSSLGLLLMFGACRTA